MSIAQALPLRSEETDIAIEAVAGRAIRFAQGDHMRFRNHRNALFLLAALALPVADGHRAIGWASKNYCEDPSEWNVHDYAAPSGGVFTAEVDGNISGDCNGDTIPSDFDGHVEFGYGGGMLTVVDADPECQIEVAHHDSSIEVRDSAVGDAIVFWVGADYGLNPARPADPCDDVDDVAVECTGGCAPPFPPGSDGAYHVFITSGTGGHITTSGPDDHISLGVGFNSGIGKPIHAHSCPQDIEH